MSRRNFLLQLAAGGVVLLTGAGCGVRRGAGNIPGTIVGANSKTGHLLRNGGPYPEPHHTVEVNVLIVGGGISGLSAKRWLQQEGVKDVLLLEMDDHFGGNATYGQNPVSKYPWGAHYIPVPDLRNREILDFLHQIGTITGFDTAGLPIYNEYHLCHDPEERLFIDGIWQDGIVPENGVPAADKEQFRRFSAEVAAFKAAVGSDGRDAFAIPVDTSSADAVYRDLDRISFRQYLTQKGYTSRYLLWYLEYGCKDDFGTNLDGTSAWAGIHYFACRKGRGVNANSSSVLTWPEGNGFLMEHLKSQCVANEIKLRQLVYRIEPVDGGGMNAYVADMVTGKGFIVHAQKLLLATPQMVNKHLLKGYGERTAACAAFAYAPWLIANITVNGFEKQHGMPLCWDNVFYGKPSVGYVNANHQDLGRVSKNVLTFYKSYTDHDPATERNRLYAKTRSELLDEILDELDFVHPGITAQIEHADLWLWGHGMVAPKVGFMWGADRTAAAQPIDNRVFFGHSDLSGISIFEEAFYRGIHAAQQIVTAS